MSQFNAMKHIVRAALEFLVENYEEAGLRASGSLVTVTYKGEPVADVATFPAGSRVGVVVRDVHTGDVEYLRKVYPLYPDDGYQTLMEEIQVAVRHLLSPLLDSDSPF